LVVVYGFVDSHKDMMNITNLGYQLPSIFSKR